ncbi:N-acetyltransferase [Brevibacillus laterosporus]|nr:GNAT family N-acetyltransferase [Brevibacillus laterosporus]TPG68278.1 N-acetyltransferase [Brevibacillus laterosporus]
MKILETDRLILRWISTDDSAFILELLNDHSWLQFIGDKGVRTLNDANNYIVNGPMDMYARCGFGLYVAERKKGNVPIGLCGLIKRDSLEDVDIGFAFLPRYWAKGYAYEAASAVTSYGKRVFGLNRIVAITSPENRSSAKLLEKLGFRFEQMIRLAHDDEELSC